MQFPQSTVLAARFEIVEKLGEGGSASVFLARDKHGDDTQVALKVLDPLRGADPVGKARFEREIAILSGLSHPRIARHLGRVSHEALDILVMEYVEGEDLASVLARGRLPVATAVEIATSLAETLDYCHDRGVLHRDLKPSNIIVSPDRGPVVLDFGVAWFSAAATLTKTGAVVGSPQYLAPEVFVSSQLDSRSDVYAIGAILLEMLTGQPPHTATNIAQLAAALHDPPPRLEHRRGVSGVLEKIVEHALAVRPEDRFATAGELAHALKRSTLPPGRSLERRVHCAACKVPLLLHLPYCPGCGAAVDWQLQPGNFAVQVLSVVDPHGFASWLTTQHSDRLAMSPRMLALRATRTPIPLAVGISHMSAERLLTEAREARCRAELVRARAIIGARLHASPASTRELVIASGLHLGTVLAVALLLMFTIGLTVVWTIALPVAIAFAGMLAAAIYVRQPLLRCRAVDEDDATSADPKDSDLRARLNDLRTDRARRLAATAVARAAPVLLGEVEGLSEATQQEIMMALYEALTHAAALDTHLLLLLARPRAVLSVEMASAEAAVAAGHPDAQDRLRELEDERTQLFEASLAHDLAVRETLQRCQLITELLQTRDGL